MKTIAQELNLYEAIHDELGIEVPEKQLANNELCRAFYKESDQNVFVFIEQNSRELKLIYSLSGEYYDASEELTIRRAKDTFHIYCSFEQEIFQGFFYSADFLRDLISEKILPRMYENVQYWIEEEREEAEKQANKDHSAFLDQMQKEVS